MFNIKIHFLLVLCAVKIYGQAPEYTQVQIRGHCPKISYVSNLNGLRVSGWWYRSYSTLNSPLCLNNEGETQYMAPLNDKTLYIQVCCRSSANPDMFTCGSEIGSGSTTSTNNSGEFTYLFDGQNYMAYALDTDYDDFVIVYGCAPRTGDEIIYVLSRDYTLSKVSLTRVRNVLQRNGIKWSKVKPVVQGPSIPYTPNSRRCGGPSIPYTPNSTRCG